MFTDRTIEIELTKEHKQTLISGFSEYSHPSVNEKESDDRLSVVLQVPLVNRNANKYRHSEEKNYSNISPYNHKHMHGVAFACCFVCVCYMKKSNSAVSVMIISSTFCGVYLCLVLGFEYARRHLGSAILFNEYLKKILCFCS